jgi:predicted dehydrogenase
MQPLAVPPKYRWAPEVPSTAVNVAQAYVRLEADLRNGTHTCPDFDDAVKRHRLLAAVEKAAQTGTRVAVG